MHKYATIPPSPLHSRGDPPDMPGSWLPTCKQVRQEEWKARHSWCKHCNASKYRWSFFSEIVSAPARSLCSTIVTAFWCYWMMEITSDRFLPEQKTLVPECSKNQQASPHCQWRWSRGSYWVPVPLPQWIRRVHRCPDNLPACFGNTLSREGKKQGKSAQKLLLPFWRLKENLACKLGRNLQGRIWVFVWQGKVLQKLPAA